MAKQPFDGWTKAHDKYDTSPGAHRPFCKPAIPGLLSHAQRSTTLHLENTSPSILPLFFSRLRHALAHVIERRQIRPTLQAHIRGGTATQRCVRLLPAFLLVGYSNRRIREGSWERGEVTWCVWVVSRRLRRSCSQFRSTGGGGDGVSYSLHRGVRQETNMDIPFLISCRLVRTRTRRQTAQDRCGGSPGIRQPGEVRPEDPCPSRLASTYTFSRPRTLTCRSSDRPLLLCFSQLRCHPEVYFCVCIAISRSG